MSRSKTSTTRTAAQKAAEAVANPYVMLGKGISAAAADLTSKPDQHAMRDAAFGSMAALKVSTRFAMLAQRLDHMSRSAQIVAVGVSQIAKGLQEQTLDIADDQFSDVESVSK